MIPLVEDIRRETSFAGVSLLYGNAHACEIKVTKEEVQSLLRSLDALGSSLQSHAPSGATSRRPYSVAHELKILI